MLHTARLGLLLLLMLHCLLLRATNDWLLNNNLLGTARRLGLLLLRIRLDKLQLLRRLRLTGNSSGKYSWLLLLQLLLLLLLSLRDQMMLDDLLALGG